MSAFLIFNGVKCVTILLRSKPYNENEQERELESMTDKIELHEILTRQFCELVAFEKDEEDYDEDPDSVKRFFDLLNEPVDPKKAKYAKAVTRILNGEAATIYFAVEFRDAPSLMASKAFCEFFPSFLKEASEKRCTRAWQTLRAMARLCFLIQCTEPPRVPSRAEIETNINQFRATKRAKVSGGSAKGSGSMQRAFFEKLLQTASCLPPKEAAACQARLHAIPLQEHTKLSAQWAEDPFVSQTAPFGGSVFTEVECASFVQVDASKWAITETYLRQLNDLSRVQQNIPASMLGTIESYATDLASKITSGESDLSTIDLQSIGEDVLRQCSEDDMSQLANNIGNLLPALGSLQQTVQEQAGANGQPLPDLAALKALQLATPEN